MPKFTRSPLLVLTLAFAAAACAPPMEAQAAGKQKASAMAAHQASPSQPIALPAGVATTEAEIRSRLEIVMPGVALDAIKPAAIPGMFELRRGSQFGYVSADGQYLITGDLVNLSTGEEITEVARKTGRLEQLAAIKDTAIAFDPPNVKADKVVTVFTDMDCGYCRKLHSEIATYNGMGIGIHYVAFPRSGPGSPSFLAAESVWCSADQRQALTRAKQGIALPPAPASCKPPTQKQYDLGRDFGLRGTPMMVLPDGEIVNGYLPPEALAERLASQGMPAAGGHSAP